MNRKMIDKKKVDLYENQKNILLLDEIEYLKSLLYIKILKAGINDDETIELSQKVDELIINYIKKIILTIN